MKPRALTSSNMPNRPQAHSTVFHSFISNRYEPMYSDYTAASKDWYQKSTVVGHNYLTNRLADIQLRRLRFWTYTRNFTDPSPTKICRHSQQVYDPVHYLLNCTAYLKHRRILKGHLRPEEYHLPDHLLAALITIKSSFLLDFSGRIHTHTKDRSDRPYGLVHMGIRAWDFCTPGSCWSWGRMFVSRSWHYSRSF